MKTNGIRQKTGLLMMAAALATALPAPKAEAVVGIATGNVPMIVAGGILAAAGNAILVPGWIRSADFYYATHGRISFRAESMMRRVRRPAAIAMTVHGAMAVVVGIVLLDSGEERAFARFNALDSAGYASLGVSETEAEIYESELEEISSLWDSAAAAAFADGVQTDAAAKPYFDREFAGLSPETLLVMAKIATQANLAE